MRWPRCESEEYIKSGKVKCKQRYRCKKCNYNYTVKVKSTGYDTNIKRQALKLYLEGLSFRSIGRFLKVSNVSVLKWIRSFGKEIENLRKKSQEVDIKVIEIDEMHTYIKEKKVIDGYGLLLIDSAKKSSTLLLGTEVKREDISCINN